jgi:hypothetical protein
MKDQLLVRNANSILSRHNRWTWGLVFLMAFFSSLFFRMAWDVFYPTQTIVRGFWPTWSGWAISTVAFLLATPLLAKIGAACWRFWHPYPTGALDPRFRGWIVKPDDPWRMHEFRNK